MSPTVFTATTEGNTALAVTWVLFSMALFAVGLRLYTDFFIIRSVRLDSYIIFFTFVRHHHVYDEC